MKKLTIIIMILIIANSCKKEEFTIENLNRNNITVLGHAGMGNQSTYPTNSYESIMNCLSIGTDGTELDVQMTKDSVLVAYHGLDLSDGTNFKGAINSLTWDELKDAKYTGTPYLNYSVVSLDQLFSGIKNISKYKFTFDCKLYLESNDPEKFNRTFMNAVIEICRNYEIERNICIESTNKDFLKLFKTTQRNYKLFFYPDDFESGLAAVKEMNLYGITISNKCVSAEQIKTAHDNNIRVALWDVASESDNIDAINKNPDFIQTDNVEGLIKLLK